MKKFDFVDFFYGSVFFSGKNDWGQEMDSTFKGRRYTSSFSSYVADQKLDQYNTSSIP